jgi:pentapeptide MXKDX repeat protein
MKTSNTLAIAAFAAALAGGSAFAQTSSTDAMKTDHMSSGAMTAGTTDDHMSSGAMTAGKKDHMASGAMTSGDHMKGKKKKDDHMASGAMTSAPKP